MRKGIISAGNWIIDKVKVIDILPERNMLANILKETYGTGGCPFNVTVNLAKLNTGIPLEGIGVVGDDTEGEFILQTLKKHSIDGRYILKTPEISTSYTDVMTEEKTGNRTFFHYRGANSLLDISHFDNIESNAAIFHLGYLLLLDKLDAEDEQYGVKAARILHTFKKQGFKTSVDVVSESSKRFQKIVIPCLPYIDYLILNETEAGQITGLEIRKKDDAIDKENLYKAAEVLIDKGVGQMVVIHFPEGGFALTNEGLTHFEPSYKVDPAEIKGTAGAGDAFCAGMLYGLHEEWSLDQSLQFANASARFNLKSPTCTDAAPDIREIKKFMAKAIKRESII